MMQQQPVLESAWPRALRIQERIPINLDRDTRRSRNFDLPQAERRLRRWKGEEPFNDPPLLRGYLEALGLEESDLMLMLGESTDSIRRRIGAKPSWLARFREAFGGEAGWPADAAGPRLTGLLSIAEPFRKSGARRLRQGVEQIVAAYPDAPFAASDAEALMLPNLARRLGQSVIRVLVLELNVARLRGQLEGEDPEERFVSFVKLLADRDFALSLFDEYPVLAESIVTYVEQWVDCSLEFFERAAHDASLLARHLGGGKELGRLIEVDAGGGDVHRNGRSVMICAFESGFRTVYKPHSLAADGAWSGLVDWFNEKTGAIDLRAAQSLNRGEYGWTEFVEAGSCDSVAELREYFRRVGATLALLYLTNSVDIHYENVVAAGVHPVVIDLETLFHGVIDERTFASQRPTVEAIRESVLRIGLLPQRAFGGGDQPGIDISGLGGEAGQLNPLASLASSGDGTDRLSLERKRVRSEASHNRPKVDGSEASAADYVDEIVDGFERACSAVRSHRDELVSPDGPIRRFAEAETRYVARPTALYGMVLLESSHPDLQRDALDRDRFLDRLRSRSRTPDRLQRLVDDEQRDLARGDVPIFLTRPNSRNLWNSDGELVPDYLDEPGLSASIRRIRNLDDRVVARQTWMIRASFSSQKLGVVTGGRQGRASAAVLSTTDGANSNLQTERLRSEALRLGDQVLDLAVEDQERIGWLGVMPAGSSAGAISASATDLYEGNPGIALFLAHLSEHTGERRFASVARKALRTAQSLYAEHRDDGRVTPDCSIFSGPGGLAYSCAHLGILWRDEELLLGGRELFKELLPAAHGDTSRDVIGGAAGYLLAASAVAERTGDKSLKEGLAATAHRLVEAADEREGGVAWHVTLDQSAEGYLLGYAHGVSGIAAALARCGDVLGAGELISCARSALAYEASRYDGRSDKTAAEPEQERIAAWCHGAAGILLGRLDYLSVSADPTLAETIPGLWEATVQRGFGDNASLCHGDLGNLVILDQAARQLGDFRLRLQVRQLVQGTVVDRIGTSTWACGTPRLLPVAGLMTGLSGIGYAMLRLAGPEIVPNVLSLELPTR